MIDHATSDAHKVAMAKLKLECSRASGESAATSTTIGRLLSSMDDETRERMARKFDICYMMAKESLPFTKYPALLELESRHGVDLGPAYRTPDSAKSFTSYIAKSQCQTFLNTLSSSGSRFFSFLMDGTTDAGNQEDELIVLLYCSKDATTCSSDNPQDESTGVEDAESNTLTLSAWDDWFDSDDDCIA